MNTSHLSDIKLNLRGTPCPLNFVKTKLKLEEMKKGELLEIILDDGDAVENVPRSIEAESHRVISIEKLEDGSFRVLAKKC